MRIVFQAGAVPDVGTLVVAGNGATRGELERRSSGVVSHALAALGFRDKRDETASVPAPAGTGLDRLVLVGLGPDGADERTGGAIVAALNGCGVETVVVALDRPAEAVARVAAGVTLRSHAFTRHKSPKPDDKPRLSEAVFLVADPAAAERAFENARAVAESVLFTRDLVTEAPNLLYPATMAEKCLALRELGVEVEILGPEALAVLGMGALLGVARGALREPRVVVLRWNGGDGEPVALIGKGVTFDSGGLCLKPGKGMEEMKWDMAGAAAVAGAVRAAAARKARVNLVGVVGLVENMPSGSAQRPGDVVRSMSGTTIEVINTDAEGRLVLADCLHYALSRFKPKYAIDLATLTGAIVVALGPERAGLFCDDDELAADLLAAGEATGERLWRMPLGDLMAKAIDSDIADVRNVGASRDGGAIVAAQFIKRFAGDTVWAHLDIAGTVWSDRAGPLTPKGASGFGVRLLDRLIADREEGAGS